MSAEDFVSKIRRGVELEKKARRILGVDSQANGKQIKKAFWLLALEHHPDKKPGDKEAERRFLALLAAYEYLMKGVGREDFDRLSHAHRVPEDFEENPWKYFAWWRGKFH